MFCAPARGAPYVDEAAALYLMNRQVKGKMRCRCVSKIRSVVSSGAVGNRWMGRNAQDFGRVLRAPVAADSSDSGVPVGHADGEVEPDCGLSLQWSMSSEG